MTTRALTSAIFLAFFAVVPGSSVAQQSLDAVDALASEGRTEEARGALETWWGSERSQSSRSDRQRGLWLRALLTVDPEMATLDYQRLVVGYPGGPYSDEALVRLAMISGSRADVLAAAGYYGSLLQDYPRSPQRERARRWLDDHSQEISKAEAEAAVVAKAKAAAEEQPSETEIREPEGEQGPTGGPTAPPEEVGRHAVQLGAFSTEQRAERLAGRLSAAGFDARVVRVEGSPLVRVRVGRFDEKSAASELMGEIRRLGYDAAVVSDVAEEGPIR